MMRHLLQLSDVPISVPVSLPATWLLDRRERKNNTKKKIPEEADKEREKKRLERERLGKAV
jgi:hypothetical protein